MALIKVTAYTPNPTEAAHLRTLRPYNSAHWKLTHTQIQDIKRALKGFLSNNQNQKCCYCSADFGETSTEVDHVAPTAIYGQFTWEFENLVLSCGYCNGFLKKSGFDTVVAPANGTYNLNIFRIVHPILHNPADHIRVEQNFHVTALSIEGAESIRLFNLLDERQRRMRRKNHYFERKERIENFLTKYIPPLKKFF